MLEIPRRFNGPPRSANGGYACGIFSALVDGPAEVTLRAPPPLDTPFQVEHANGARRVMHGDVLVAEVRAAEPDLEVPEPVPLEVARAAERPLYPPDHPFPTCFVCGTERDDGLAIHAGPVPGRDVLAAVWTPAADLVDGGAVREEFVWASLDCPSGYAAWEMRDEDILLGRLTCAVVAEVHPEPHVVVAWPLGNEGRKLHAGAALYDGDGRLKAFARATWVVMAG